MNVPDAKGAVEEEWNLPAWDLRKLTIKAQLTEKVQKDGGTGHSAT